MQKDSDYRDNQKHCVKEWHDKHPDYYKGYREMNPQYVEKNRTNQKLRDMKRRLPVRMSGKNGLVNLLAKMDSLTSRLSRRSAGIFKLIPKDRGLLAKMDSLMVELIPI